MNGEKKARESETAASPVAPVGEEVSAGLADKDVERTDVRIQSGRQEAGGEQAAVLHGHSPHIKHRTVLHSLIPMTDSFFPRFKVRICSQQTGQIMWRRS